MRYLRVYLLLILVASVAGCDFLTYDETSNYAKEDVFSDFNRTKQFLTNIYSRLPGGFNSVNGAMRASGSDNAVEINPQESVHRFNDGSWSASNPLDAKWGQMYNGIRAANRFLEEFDIENFKDRQYNYDYDAIVKQAKLYPPQARFLRAYFYFNLIKRYGSVPLVTNVLTVTEANNVEQASFDKVVDFIVSECDAIIPKLPISYQSIPKSETGRATRGAAMALKARTLLYAASPLHNSSGNQQEWIAAAQASKALIDSSYYSLANNYSNIFNNRRSNELIFERRLGTSNFFESSNFPVGYEGADPGTAPTQNLVNSYEMQTTGMAIDETGSGYDSSNPYQDRDPRLKETVIVNNAVWKGRNVEIWKGGKDGLPKEAATPTGYYLKKQVIENVSLDPNNTTRAVHTWIFFRYAEVLLNYAESMNEAYGPENAAGMGMTARQAVNVVRSRVNMPNFPVGMSQDEFRQKLRNERRVELAFENHRFWDLRRWKIGPSTTDIYGVEIIKNNDGSFSYDKRLIRQRNWANRMYLYPIPQSEIFKNKALKQNEGW